MAAKRPARASLRYAKAPLRPRYRRELHQSLGHCSWKLHFATSENYYDIYQTQKFPIFYNIRMDPLESYDEIADRSGAVQRKQWLNEPVQELLQEHVKSLQEHPLVQAAPTLDFSALLKQMQAGAN